MRIFETHERDLDQRPPTSNPQEIRHAHAAPGMAWDATRDALENTVTLTDNSQQTEISE